MPTSLQYLVPSDQTTLARPEFQPQHSANRHDTDCGSAGGDRVAQSFDSYANVFSIPANHLDRLLRYRVCAADRHVGAQLLQA
jgi:hypothetical protein